MQRSNRVKEQVKIMSLSRKATINNGVVGVTNGYTAKLNGSSFLGNSATGNLGRSPTKRLEVSPLPSPEMSSPSRFNRSMHQSRVQTSGLGQSQVTRNGKSLFKSTSDRYNLTKTPNPSAPLGRSFRQTGGAQSMDSSRVFQQTVGTKSIRQTVVKPETQRPEQCRDFLLNKLGKDCQKSFLLKSYPPSVASSGKLVEAGPPVQQTQTQTRGSNKNPEMTLAQAFTYLIQDNKEKQEHAIKCLQKEFLQDDNWKEVFQPEWIKHLLQLLSHENKEVQCVSAGVLRVVVHEDSEKKMEVEEKQGLNIITDALNCSEEKETRKHLTGLLWNLSAHDEIKEKFSQKDIQTLTSCLRNLSSADTKIRDEMRNCKNLIDSIVLYVRNSVADGWSNDESIEHCICILQNLSYMLDLNPKLSLEGESEAKKPEPKPKNTSVGCFPSRSVEASKKDPPCKPPALVEKANPVGVEWLWSPILIRTYLSFLACSKHDATREGVLGALQNITAGKKKRSEAIAHFIISKEDGLQKIKSLLSKCDLEMCDSALIHLIRNLSCHRSMQPVIVEHVVEKLVQLLPNDDRNNEKETLGTTNICQILINLTTGDKENAKSIIKLGALNKINNISRTRKNHPTSAGRAACVLLQLMWKYSELHSYIKKETGLKKRHFINDRTNAVMNSKI
ncbi:hypothetical protein OJAV_G00224510 [Oryzias javanicus]|uniref:Plakophilin-2 n=1 Tax=Oryzias javanicus TaxID=123683 RepID=A0A3S2MD28_ORYJA|nr:hypothetical protein OJAV_G00224510 [Oryzias javanicus]